MYDIAIIFKRNLLHGKVFTNYSTSARKNNHHPSPIIKMLTKTDWFMSIWFPKPKDFRSMKLRINDCVSNRTWKIVGPHAFREPQTENGCLPLEISQMYEGSQKVQGISFQFFNTALLLIYFFTNTTFFPHHNSWKAALW